MRRWLIGGAIAVLLLVGGATAGYVLYKRDQSQGRARLLDGGVRHDRGGGAAAAAADAEQVEVVWPMYGYDAARAAFAPFDLARRSGASGRSAARHLLEFPPAIAYGRLYFTNNFGVDVRGQHEDRQARVEVPTRPLRRRLAGGGGRHRLPVVPEQAAVQQQGGAGRPGQGDRVRGRLREDPLADDDRPDGELAALAGDRVYVGDWRGRVWALDARTGRMLLDASRRRPIKGAVALAGGRLYVGSYDGHVYCARRADGQARSGRRRRSTASAARHASTRRRRSPTGASTSARPTARSTRSARRAASCAGRTATGGYVYASPAVWQRARASSARTAGGSTRFDAATGDVRWRSARTATISGSATVIGGVVYFATLEGRTYALERAHRQAALDVPGREVHAASSPIAGTPLSSSATAGSMGWFREVRYVVTGAAGFIGSHLAEALAERGPRVVGVDCFTDYYDPAREGGERARRSTCAGSTSPRSALDLDGVDGVFHLAGAAGRAQLRRRLSALRAPERARDAARVRGGCARRRARRLRLLVVGLRRGGGVSDARGRPRRSRSRRTGSRSSAASTSRARTRASFGLDAVVLRYFTVYGPRQRPDMFFRASCDALLEATPFEIFGDGAQSRSFTYVGDAVAATIARWSAAERAPYNVGGGDGGDDARGDRAARADLRPELEVAARRARCRATSRRTKADMTRIREALGWAARHVPRRRVCKASGQWASVESPPR